MELHPEFADEIKELFASIHQIEQLKTGVLEERDLNDPKKIGEYEILGVIGRGGSGIVYEAVHQDLKRRVALKVLSQPLANSLEFSGNDLVEKRGFLLSCIIPTSYPFMKWERETIFPIRR